jgi:small subunit ribosomal protein S8
MSQDTAADALNMIRNAKKARKENIVVMRMSNLLIEILKIMKQKNAIKNYNINPKDKCVEISIGEVSECKSIKPRFTAQVNEIEKYLRRFLPSRNFGKLIITTSKGLLNQNEAYENKIGGSLIAYFY